MEESSARGAWSSFVVFLFCLAWAPRISAGELPAPLVELPPDPVRDVQPLLSPDPTRAGAAHAPSDRNTPVPDDQPTDEEAYFQLGVAGGADTGDSPAPSRAPTLGGAWIPQGPAPIQSGQVENQAPNNEVVGALHTVLAHPSNANILYVGGTNGGVWKTTNATNANPTWTPLTDSLRSLNVGAMEFDPTDATFQTIVVGLGRTSSLGRDGGLSNGILRTTDGGATWTSINPPELNGAHIVGIAARGNTIIAGASPFGAQPGVHRTTDGGANWTTISGAMGSGLPAGAVFDVVVQQPLVAYASVQLDGVYRTTDFGATWAKISGGDATLSAAIGQAGNNNAEMAVAPNGRLYVVVMLNGQPNYIGYSSNPGAPTPSWTAMDLPRTMESNGDTEGLSPREKPGGQGAIHLSVIVDPTDSNTIYVAGDRQDSPFPNFIGANDFSGRLFRGDTTIAPTGGVPSPQWEHLTHSNAVGAIPQGGTASTSAPHADSREMAFDANGNLVEVDDGGVTRRTSPKNNIGDWFSLNSNLQVSESHSVAYDSLTNTLIAGHQDTGTPQQLTAGGLRWEPVDLRPTFNFFSNGDGGDVAIDNTSLAGSNQSVRYSSFQNFQLFRRQVYDASNMRVSQNFPGLLVGGTPVTQVDANIQFVQPIALNATDPTRAIMGTAVIYESGDSFETLVSRGGFCGFFMRGFAFGGTGNADVIYVGCGADVLFRTTAGANMGTNSTYPGQNVRDVHIDPVDWMRVYAADSDQVFFSSNATTSWTEVTGNLQNLDPGIIRSLDFVAAGSINGVVVGADRGVFLMRRDAPGLWHRLGSGLPNAPAFDLDFDPADGVLVVGTLGRGTWLLNQFGGFSDTVGLYDPAAGVFFLRNAHGNGAADFTYFFGPASSTLTPLSGDWDASADATAGLYDPAAGAFFLRNVHGNGPADETFFFGPASSTLIPLTGDWNGDGQETVGLYNPSTGAFFLRNAHSNGPADATFFFGPANGGLVPIVGDWDMDGDDGVGLYAPSTGAFFLRNELVNGPADETFFFGPANSSLVPITGDWNGNVQTTVGLYDPSTGAHFLRNSHANGAANHTFFFGPGGAGLRSVTGNWDAQ